MKTVTIVIPATTELYPSEVGDKIRRLDVTAKIDYALVKEGVHEYAKTPCKVIKYTSEETLSHLAKVAEILDIVHQQGGLRMTVQNINEELTMFISL